MQNMKMKFLILGLAVGNLLWGGVASPDLPADSTPGDVSVIIVPAPGRHGDVVGLARAAMVANADVLDLAQVEQVVTRMTPAAARRLAANPAVKIGRAHV